MTADLLVVIPTRSRPQNIARLLDAVAGTCRADTRFVFGVDWDDPMLRTYPGIGHLPDSPPDWAQNPECAYVLPAFGWPADFEYEIRSGYRQVVGWMNALAVARTGLAPYVGHFGDDNLPRTIGWDERICEALARQPFAYANDLYGRPGPGHPNALCCHVFTRSEIVRALGFLGQPCFRHMYVDAAWMQWGEACGIAYLEDVVLEHLHYTNGKAPRDVSYIESTSLIPHDLGAYNAYCRGGGLARDIGTIRMMTERGAVPDQSLIDARSASYNIPAGGAPAGWQPGDPLR